MCIITITSHQASEDSEGHGSQEEQHQDQIQGAPDQLHALNMLGLWGQPAQMQVQVQHQPSAYLHITITAALTLTISRIEVN